MTYVTALPRKVLKRIHVNQHVIRARGDSPLRVKMSKANIEANEIRIVRDGEVLAKIVYRPERPLSCGARVWIETSEAIEIVR